jgi:MoaA/NifB/PqqE/SkfB family radical SAM enzyme
MSKPVSGKKSGRSVPGGHRLLAYLGKGERAAAVVQALGRKKEAVESRRRVRKDGSLVVPPSAAKRLGLVPGSVADIRFDRGRLEVLPDIHSLARVYVEPTSRCGLSCRTCLRNTWNEPTGDMDPVVFDRLNAQGPHHVELGIAFVLLRRNLADLKDLDKLARTVGARRVSVSHVLPYSPEMEKEMLCLQTLTLDTFTAASGKTEINLPRLDVNNTTKEAMFSLLQGFENLSFMGNRLSVDARRCRFIHDRCTFVRWDGKVTPCAGLLHTHRTYLYGLERTISAYILGNIESGDLFDIWNSPEYARFREKVRDFDFSPCHVCGGCTMLEKNEEDCYGNTYPVCGGCLWAQGVIQCP